MNTLHLQLATPVETLFDEDVEQVIVDTEAGQITVLPNHSYLVSVLVPGEIIVRQNGKDTPLAISNGTLEMSGNKMVILTDSAENAYDIDVKAVREKAKALAKELEAQEEMDITTYNTLKRQLQHEQARLRIGSKWRS